ncbi:hypothetical protein [Cellulomonas sp. KH9]|uniref:hypothetical protein n=1 Tax=Cellulomonas sp. KH9 TaxID=1855324 RepID=UPI0008EF32DE|nr:hypothetical protein [Cellulomonas sp. KH9]SFK46978.1 hypothetical protein SAMN05216467_3468 [Cellulomonas sp. KH9]
MAEDRELDGRHAAVRAAHDAWLSEDDADAVVLEAVEHGLLAVPVLVPQASPGLPHQRTSREGSVLQRRRR